MLHAMNARPRATAPLLLCTLWPTLLFGCATTPSSDVPRLEAYGADGKGPSTQQLEALAKSHPEGMVVRYAKGDQIVVSLAVQGGLFTSTAPGEVVLECLEPAEVWMGPQGVRLRVDGGPWRGWSEAVDGKLAVGLSLRQDDPVNRASIEIIAVPAK